MVTLETPRREDLAAMYDPARDRYEEVIAPARTWGYERDAEQLRRRGMALGASLLNTLVMKYVVIFLLHDARPCRRMLLSFSHQPSSVRQALPHSNDHHQGAPA